MATLAVPTVYHSIGDAVDYGTHAASNLYSTGRDLLVGSVILRLSSSTVHNLLKEIPTSYLPYMVLGALALQHLVTMSADRLSKRFIEPLAPNEGTYASHALSSIKSIMQKTIGVGRSSTDFCLKAARNFVIGAIVHVLAMDLINYTTGFQSELFNEANQLERQARAQQWFAEEGSSIFPTPHFTDTSWANKAWELCSSNKFANRILNGWNTASKISYFTDFPLQEEFAFRFLLQHLFLNAVVRKTVSWISSEKARLVDSKIYTGCRILLASACFAFFHRNSMNPLNQKYTRQYGATSSSDAVQNMVDEAIHAQVLNTFVTALFVWGPLYEKLGFAASFGAHSINNLMSLIYEN